MLEDMILEQRLTLVFLLKNFSIRDALQDSSENLITDDWN